MGVKQTENRIKTSIRHTEGNLVQAGKEDLEEFGSAFVRDDVSVVAHGYWQHVASSYLQRGLITEEEAKTLFKIYGNWEKASIAEKVIAMGFGEESLVGVSGKDARKVVGIAEQDEVVGRKAGSKAIRSVSEYQKRFRNGLIFGFVLVTIWAILLTFAPSGGWIALINIGSLVITTFAIAIPSLQYLKLHMRTIFAFMLSLLIWFTMVAFIRSIILGVLLAFFPR